MRRLSTPFAISVCRHLQSSSVAVAALRGQGEQAAETIEFNEHETVIDVNENVTSLNKRVDERTRVLCSEGYGPSTDLLTGITPQNTLHIHTPPMHPEDVAVQRQVLALAAPELNNITVEQAPDLSKKLHSYQALPLHTVQPLLHEHNVNTNRAASLTRLVRSEMIEQWSSVNRKWEDQLREVSQMIINQVMNDHVHQLNTFSALQGEQRRAVTEMVMNCIRDEMDELRRTLSVQATNTQRLLEHTVAKEEQEAEHDNEEKVNHQQTFTKPQTETGYAFPIEQLVHSVTSRVAEQLQSGFMSSQENTSFAIEQLQQRVTQYFQQLQQNVSEALQKMESLQLSTKSTKENIATHDLSFAEKDENSTDATIITTKTLTSVEQEETNESTGTGSPLQTATMPHTQTRLLAQMSQEIRHAMEESMLAQQEHVSGMLRDILSAVQARDKDLDERHTRNAESQTNMKEAHQQLLEEKERHTDVTERDDHNDTLHKDSKDDKKSLIINQFHALASENRVQIRELEEFIEGALQTATDNIRLSMTMELKKLTKQGSKEVNKEVKSFTSASEKDDQSEDHKETVVVDLIQGINVELDRALSMSETSLQTIHATKASVELIEQRQQHVERVLNELKVLMEQTSLELHAQHHTLQSSLQQQAEQVASSLSEALAHHNQHQHETSPATTQVDPEGTTNQITLEKTHELTQPASISPPSSSSTTSVLLSSPSSAVQAELRDHLSHMTRLIGELRQEVQVVDSHTATIINAQQVQREQELEQLRQDLLNMSNALTQSITNVNPLESSAKLASTIEQMYDKLNKFCTEDWQSKLREAASVAAADAVNAAMQTQLVNLPVLLSTSATQLQKPEESLSREPEQQQEQALPLQERYLSQISKEEIASTVEQVIRPHMERLVHEADNLHQARRNLQAQEMIELTNAFTLAVHSALNEFAITQGKELQAAVEQAREASVQASQETEPARESTTELNALETRLTQHVHSDMEASSNKLQNELITQLDTSISHKLQDLQEKLIQSFQSESNTPPEIDLTNLFKYIDGAVTVIRDELMQQKELNQTQSTQLVESISRMVQHNFTSHETSLESKLAAQMTTCLENAMAEVKSMVQREEKSRNARHNELDTQLNVLPDRVEERVSGLLRKVQQTISDGAKTHTTALEHMEEKMQTLPTLVEIQSSTRKVELATSSAIRELGTQIDTETSLLNDVMVELRKNAAATAAASVAAKSNDKEDILRETEKLHDSYKTLNDKVEIMEGAAGGRFQEIMKAAENNNAAIKVIRGQLETLQSTVTNIHGPQHIALLESIQELLFRENMHEEERAEPQTSTTTTTTTNTATTSNAESNISKSNLEGNTLSDADNNTELLMKESNSAKVLKSLEAIHEQLKEHSAQLIKLQTEAAKVTAQNDKLLETNVHESSSSSSPSLSNVNDTVTNTSKDVLQAQQQQQQQQQQEELLIKRIEELLQRLNTASTTAITATATTSPSPSNTSTTATDVEGKADVQKILFELRQEIHDLRDMVEKQHKPASESIVVSDANAKVATSTSSPPETHEEVKAERENVHEDVSETVIDTDVLSVAVVEGMQPKLNEMSHSLYTQLSSLLDKVQSRIEEVEKTHHTNHQEVLSSVGQIAQDLRSAIKDINTVAENIERTHTTSELRNTNTKTAMDTSSMTTIAEEQSSLTCKAMEQTLEVHTRSVLDALQDAQQSTDAIVNRYRADLLQAMRELPQQIGNVVQEHLTHAESTHNDHLAKTLNTHFTEQASTIQRYMESNIAHVMTEQTNGVIKEIAQMHGDYVQRLHKDNSASQSSTLQAMSELSKVAKSLESGHQTLLQAQEQTRQKVEDTLRSQKDLNESFVLLRRQEEERKELEHKNKLEKEKEEQQKEKKASSMSASTLASLPSETTASQETQQEVLVTKMSERYRSILPTWLLLLLTPLAVCVAMLLCAYYLFACFLLAFVPLPESHLRGTTPEKVAATTTPTLPSSSSSLSPLQTQPNTATPHELNQRTLPTELTNNNNDRGHTSRRERAASPPHKSHNRSSRIADSVL